MELVVGTEYEAMSTRCKTFLTTPANTYISPESYLELQFPNPSRKYCGKECLLKRDGRIPSHVLLVYRYFSRLCP